MPLFRVHRMRETTRQQFRWAPHTGGVTQLKPRDFEPAGEIDAESFYDAWTRLRRTDHPLEIGDALETEQGELRICKYVGIEEARWIVPEPRPASDVPAEHRQAMATA